MGVSDSARRQSAPDGAQPFLDPDEFLARAAGPGAACLGFLDLAPVVIIGWHDPALFQKRIEASRAGPVAHAPRGHGSRDLVGDFVAVGPVGSDRSARSAAGPADSVEAVGNVAALIDELAALERYIGDRRSRVTDRADNQRRRDLVGLARPPGGAAVVKHRFLDDDPFSLAVALDSDGLREKVKDDPLRLVRLEVGEATQQPDRLAKSRLERLVGLNRWEIAGFDDRHSRLEVAEFAKLLWSHRDLVRPAPAKNGDRTDR